MAFWSWIFGQRGFPAPLGAGERTGPAASAVRPVGSRSDVRRAGDKVLEPWREWSVQGHGMQRGMPAPFAAADHRPLDTVEHRIPYGLPTYKMTRRYDRGSAAFAFDAGRLFSNPIGAGVVFNHQLPIFSSLIGQVIPGQGIFWNNQTIGTAGPELGPLYSPQVLNSLLGPTLGQAVVSQNYLPSTPSGVSR